MKESKFSVASKNPRINIIGGFVWKAPKPVENDKDSVKLNGKTLCIAIRSDDTIELIIKQLQKLTRNTSFSLYFKLIFTYLMEPVLLIMPAVFMVLLIGLLGAYGNLINELLSLGNGSTTVLVNKNQMFFVYTSFFILIAYLFPFIFQGDFVQTFSDAKKFLDSNERHRSRAAKALYLLSSKSKYVDRVELWDPGLLREGQDWVGKTLIPGIIEAQLPTDIYIHIGEKFATRKLVDELVEHPIKWEESVIEEEETATPIAMEYLQNWEKELLPVMVCASTANVPDNWYVNANQKTESEDTVLINVLSLPLMELLVEHFGSRFFSKATSREKVSVEVFINRCLNDYGLLSPVNELTSNMYIIEPSIVEEKRSDVRAEMEYVCTWLQISVEKVLEKARDPAAAVILAGTHAITSIYNERKLLSVEGFIKAIIHTEQYLLLKKYWKLMSVVWTETGGENLEAKLFRLIRTKSLRDLVQAFQRAGMYERTSICYDYLRAIYPVYSGIGESNVLSQQGKYTEAVEKLIEMDRNWLGGKLSPDLKKDTFSGIEPDSMTKIDLYITLMVIVVMNRVSEYRDTVKLCFGIMEQILASTQDGERDSYQMARYYNVLASYYEWEGDLEKALETYDKGLKIPEVDESMVSSLLVNQGIAYRMIGKLKSEAEESIDYLKKGIQYNWEGVYAKQIIGNEDQLPVALHNLAETCIELAYRLQEKKEKIDTYQQAYEHSQLGLDINERIHSTKKRGQLLCERFLALYWLKNMEAPLPSSQADAQQALLEWVKAKAGSKDYDVEVVLDLMLRTDAFAGNSLEMLGEWLEKEV
jgi:tetratricopeptide (TPR) repeat protein